ncbi:MAG: DNA polymerase III subunit delta [Hyphomonadaceae bacterium]|nr:DNA polymerase III subunit delta [Hyphomonadaceae bacterium]
MKLTGAAARAYIDKGDPTVHAALLYGPNRALTADVAKALVRRALSGDDDPFALTRFADDDLKRDKAALADAMVAQSLLGGERVVWVRLESDAHADTVIAALAQLDRAAAALVVEGGDLGGSSRLVKAFEKAANAACIAFYEESEAERAAFARQYVKDAGLALTPEAQSLLADILPSDRGVARQELDKLVAYAHGAEGPATPADIEAAVAGSDESELDEAARAALQGKIGDALEGLSRIDALSGVSAIKALQRRVLRLLEARQAMDRGATPSEAAAQLKPPVFWKERDAFAAQVRMWTAPRLAQAVAALWRAEITAKTSGAPQDLVAADAFRAVARLVA